MSLLLDWRGREIKYFGLEGRRGQSKIEERRRVQCKEGKGEKCRGEEGSEKNADHKRIENVLLMEKRMSNHWLMKTVRMQRDARWRGISLGDWH